MGYLKTCEQPNIKDMENIIILKQASEICRCKIRVSEDGVIYIEQTGNTIAYSSVNTALKSLLNILIERYENLLEKGIVSMEAAKLIQLIKSL